jgi:hypothetical protein
MTQPVTLELAGQAFELKPDFARLVALEDYFGRPLLRIADLFIGGEASLTLIAEALVIVLDWPPAARLHIGDDIVATGVGTALRALQAYFLAALGTKGGD